MMTTGGLRMLVRLRGLPVLCALAVCLASAALAAPLTTAENLNREQWRLEVLLTRARAQLDANKVADARASCDKAHEIGFFDARLESLAGEVYLRQSKWADAAVALRRATGSERDKQMLAKAVTQLGWERRDTGAMDDAIRLWTEAVQADSKNAWAQSSLGLGYLARRQLVLARRHCQWATELQADWAGGWCNLGLVLYVKGEAAAAEKALMTALRLSPEDPQALSDLAFAKYEQGQTADAVAIWEKLVATGVASADQLAGLAIGCLAAGDKDKAVATYKQAVAIDSSYLKPEALSSRRYWSEKAVKAACELIAAVQG